MKRNWSVKTTQCITCGDDIEWTTRKPNWCKACYRVRKNKQQAGYDGRKPKVEQVTEKADSLPEVDWVMEKQFPAFFDLVGVRYNKMSDVAKGTGRKEVV